jgi:hypothetical protein
MRHERAVFQATTVEPAEGATAAVATVAMQPAQ